MSNSLHSYFKNASVIALFILGMSCDDEKMTQPATGKISFSVQQRATSGGRQNQDWVPASVLISLNDASGNTVYEDQKISLLSFGQGFMSESVELNTGTYTLSKFLVLTSENKILYAAPLEGSPRAPDVTRPLPLTFVVTENQSQEIVPQVLTVTGEDTPEGFGYTSFGFEVVKAPETVKAVVKVELRIGTIDYIDVETTVLVSGYDSLNQKKWTQEFPVSGYAGTMIPVKNNYHHYTFEINKWGIHDKQTVTHQQLWEGRADGPAVAKHVLGGAVAAKRLLGYISYMETPDPAHPGQTYQAPQYKVAYEYNTQGRVGKMTFYGFDLQVNDFVAQRYFRFEYKYALVDRITGFTAPDDKFYIEDRYTYDPEGRAVKIQELNYGTGINSEVAISYSAQSRTIHAAYTFSNGGGFEYEFEYVRGDLLQDKTTRGAEVCNEGKFTYDRNINPLRHLGYTDFLLRNYSIHNRLTESVHYMACAFPSLVPEYYTHEYDEHGYPKVSTTHYAAGNRIRKAETRYYYQ